MVWKLKQAHTSALGDSTVFQRYGVKLKTSVRAPAGWLRWGAHVLVSVLPGHARIRKMSGVFYTGKQFFECLSSVNFH